MIGSTSLGTATPTCSPTHGATRMETRYATAAARSVTSGAPSARKLSPRIAKTTSTVASVTQTRLLSISSHSASRAGTVPVTPTSASSGWPASTAAQLRAMLVSSPIDVSPSKNRNVIAVVESSRAPGMSRSVLTRGSANEMPSSSRSRASTARSATRACASALRPPGSRWTTAVWAMTGMSKSSADRWPVSTASASSGTRSESVELSASCRLGR